jgi:hypothetical protein
MSLRQLSFNRNGGTAQPGRSNWRNIELTEGKGQAAECQCSISRVPLSSRYLSKAAPKYTSEIQTVSQWSDNASRVGMQSFDGRFCTPENGPRLTSR